MLVNLKCDKFRNKEISFHKGLNVVLGDESATNSIGKSSLLMVLDFVFGGESILNHNKDIIEELGHHDYYFEFDFLGKSSIFKRSTNTPELIYNCNHEYEETSPLTIDEYKTILKKSYMLEEVGLTFRSIVSLFSRVWGKDNLDVKQPLHSFKNQKSSDSIDNLIKLYQKYETIRSLSVKAKLLTDKKKTLVTTHTVKNEIIHYNYLTGFNCNFFNITMPILKASPVLHTFSLSA